MTRFPGVVDLRVSIFILLMRLCRASPFEVEHYDTNLLYQCLFEVLARFWAHDERVKMRSFGIMQRMWALSNAHIAHCTQLLISIAYLVCVRLIQRLVYRLR
ncbi:hypothetical protein BC628DRAFT_1350763 [Trametes gibbosa]|nr:hypothetical protein BC628DRAFT_1350763 [Trametes gibbosa]